MRRTLMAITAASASVVVGATIAIPFAAWLERTVAPVMVNWTVLGKARSDGDLLVWGTVVKARNCRFIPPILARDDTGQSYIVESMNPVRSMPWAATDTPHRFGPWRVAGGAGKVLTFEQIHRCHPMWDQVSELGTVTP